MAVGSPTPKDQKGTDTSPKMAAEFPLMAGKTAMQAWMEIGAEAVRFVSDRLQQDVQTQQAMMACTSLEDMRKVQSEFFKVAQENYAAEARKLMEIAGMAAISGPFPASRQGKLGYDDVPV